MNGLLLPLLADSCAFLPLLAFNAQFCPLLAMLSQWSVNNANLPSFSALLRTSLVRSRHFTYIFGGFDLTCFRFFLGDQNLNYMILDVQKQLTLSEGLLPLSRKSRLEWIGFSDEEHVSSKLFDRNFRIKC
jgi:hypothetical protein